MVKEEGVKDQGDESKRTICDLQEVVCETVRIEPIELLDVFEFNLQLLTSTISKTHIVELPTIEMSAFIQSYFARCEKRERKDLKVKRRPTKKQNETMITK